MQPWNSHDYGIDQFHSSYGDPYFDMNELKYNTRPSETIQMSTPINTHIRSRNVAQQADVNNCEEALLQIRNNNDDMYNMYKNLHNNKKESFIGGDLSTNDKYMMYLMLFIIVMVVILLVQFQNTCSRINQLEEITRFLLYMKKD